MGAFGTEAEYERVEEICGLESQASQAITTPDQNPQAPGDK